MKKTDFIALTAEKAQMTKKDTEKALDVILQCIQDVLEQGDKLQFPGFGTFEIAKRKARMGRNPKTGEPKPIAAATVPVFRPCKQLKDRVNN